MVGVSTCLFIGCHTTFLAAGSAYATAELAKILTLGPGGHYWMSSARSKLASPVLTGRMGLLLNYMGQSSRARIVACTDPTSFQQRIQLVRNVSSSLKTAKGLAAAQKQYTASQQAFKKAVGASFKGSLFDYWASYGGGSLDWVPYLELFGTDSCPPGGQPLQAVLKQLFGSAVPKRSQRRRLLGGVCAIPKYVAACSFDSKGTLAKCYTSSGGPVKLAAAAATSADDQQGPQRRKLQGFFSTLFDWLFNGCVAAVDTPIPIVSGLVTAADVANAAGPTAVWGSMYEIQSQLCENRANDARATIFADNKCTDSYEDDVGAFTVQCKDHPDTGISRPWGRFANGCPNPPFYLKQSSGCSGPYKWAKKNC